MIDRLPHRHPAQGCTCPVCQARRRARLRELSLAQRRALSLLSATIPRHVDDLRGRGVRWKTMASMMQGSRERPALVRELPLREVLLHCHPYTFVILTADGADHVAAGRKTGLIA